MKYGKSIGRRKDFGREFRQDGAFACRKGNAATEINQTVTSHRRRGLNYERVDLILWTSRSILYETEQNLTETLGSAHRILRPNGGVLVGVPLLQKPEDAKLALQKVEAIGNNIFGKSNVRHYPVGSTDTASPIPMSYVFMRK